MTCENCLHKDVCRDSETNYCETGGAELCTYFITEIDFVKQFLNDVTRKLAMLKSYIDTDSVNVV